MMLSKRQLEILLYASKGLINHAIASELCISVNTVKYHKKKLYETLNVSSANEAIAAAYRLGLFESSN